MTLSLLIYRIFYYFVDVQLLIVLLLCGGHNRHKIVFLGYH